MIKNNIFYWVNAIISLIGCLTMVVLMIIEITRPYCWIPLIIGLFAYCKCKLVIYIHDLYENRN